MCDGTFDDVEFFFNTDWLVRRGGDANDGWMDASMGYWGGHREQQQQQWASEEEEGCNLQFDAGGLGTIYVNGLYSGGGFGDLEIWDAEGNSGNNLKTQAQNRMAISPPLCSISNIHLHTAHSTQHPMQMRIQIQIQCSTVLCSALQCFTGPHSA